MRIAKKIFFLCVFLCDDMKGLKTVFIPTAVVQADIGILNLADLCF